MTVLEEIAAECRRHVEVEGWTAEHDDTHVNGEMARAAACYADPRIAFFTVDGYFVWPWDRKWWKPKSRRRDLIRAAALIVAEIERLDRQDQTNGPR